MKKNYFLFLITILLISSSGCKLLSPTVSAYDSYSYMQTISNKVETLNLMDMATEDYQSHQKEIRVVQNEIQKVYEYEKHRPKNEFTTNQWQVLIDTTGNLWGGFIIKWRTESKLNKAYIAQKKKQIGTSFDQIAELESKKIKPADIKN